MVVIDHDELELQLAQAEAAFQATQTNYEQVKQLAEGRVKFKIDVAEADVSFAKAALQQVKDWRRLAPFRRLRERKPD